MTAARAVSPLAEEAGRIEARARELESTAGSWRAPDGASVALWMSVNRGLLESVACWLEVCHPHGHTAVAFRERVREFQRVCLACIGPSEEDWQVFWGQVLRFVGWLRAFSDSLDAFYESAAGPTERPKRGGSAASQSERKMRWETAGLMLLRQDPSLTDAEIARRVGVSPSSVGRSVLIRGTREMLQGQERASRAAACVAGRSESGEIDWNNVGRLDEDEGDARWDASDEDL